MICASDARGIARRSQTVHKATLLRGDAPVLERMPAVATT